MSKAKDTPSLVDHTQKRKRREDHWAIRQDVEETIEQCARALELGQRRHWYFAGRKLKDVLIPSLLTSQGRSPRWYASRLSGDPKWCFDAIESFVEAPDAFIAAVQPRDGSQKEVFRGQTRGSGVREDAARMVIDGAFHSCVAIAENQEMIRREMASEVDAVGFATKLGEHLRDPRMDLGDPVRLVTEQSGSLKTLFTGGTGQGKSVALEREGEDFFCRTDEPTKLIDPLGFRDGENWFYDVPQEDPDLQRVREEQGLPASFIEGDDSERSCEILIPLTPGISDQALPFDAEREEFTVRPFTIPASDISKPLLVSMLATRLTPQQEAAIRDAYDEVDFRRDDWTLADLAEEIRSRDELKDSKKKPAIRTLRQLQNQGFVRDQDDEHTVDWRELFEDTATITVFSQAFMDDEIARLICFGYLIERIADTRDRMHDLPQCAVLMRELWKVCPHNQRQSFDARAAALQEAIGHLLTKLFRENRHSGVSILGDTQQPSDLLKAVRELFNRYVVFDTNRDTAEDIFEWTSNDRWRSFYDTLTPTKGEASVVGQVEPAINESEIEFVGPIRYVPASHHHRRAKADQTGWHARCKLLEREELREPSHWDDEVPRHLRIDVGYDEEDSGRADPREQPVEAFADRCLRYDSSSALTKTDVYQAFNEFAAENEHGRWDFDDHTTKTKFGSRLTGEFDGKTANTRRDGASAWNNLAFTAAGRERLEEVMAGHEDAAAPITGR